MRTLRVEWLALGFLLVVQVVEAMPQDVALGPDLELLEFLGTWEGEDEELIDTLIDDELGPSDDPETRRVGGRDLGRERTGSDEASGDRWDQRDNRIESTEDDKYPSRDRN